MKNLDHPEKTVYGFFEASEVKTRSIVVDGVDNAPLRDFGDCQVDGVWFEPVYMYEWRSMYIPVRNLSCVLCESTGATSVMPEFWKN